ncbi:hypothetical protein FGG08_005013 [Glutinoglossum americanum]|uniref:RRM domain-containing protein n=1 Tax=Glutinoglossum americanum TaxID=1670608 RepID=A0A9P8HVC9_9PEZI|nr:hypothetical protein FGG08_005013 [Glutinoglossum americanum]
MAPAKKNQTKMSLGAFMTDESLGSWADEMEDTPMPSSDNRSGYGERRAFSSTDRYGGYGDRGSERFGAREELPLPDKPPFTAHIGNLSFDITESEIENFFHDCGVTNVRIVEDKLERKPKGFGYVEFASVDGLKKALELSGSQFSGRNIRISVAEPPKDRDRPDARDFGDWTRKGPLPDLPSNNRRASDRGFGPRNFESDRLSDAGSDRADRRRSPFNEGDGKVRDFGNWERKGPLSPLPPTAPAARNGRPTHIEAGADRKRSPAWGEGRSQDGSRPPRRDFTEKPHVERAPTAPELDNEWRSKMRPNPPASKESTPSREQSGPPSPAAAPALTVRPKLNLQKRTVSEAEGPSATSTASDSRASPFGSARPIDTAAKEREIEEKRLLALRLKKEHEEKEKRLAKEAAKAEKPATAVPLAGKDKENGGETLPPGKSFEILRKAGDEGDVSDAAEEENEAVQERVPATVERPVKPRETKNIPPRKSEGAWRRKPDNKRPENPTEQGGQVPEEEGWSTVSKPKNSRRGGHQNQAARAIAS